MTNDLRGLSEAIASLNRSLRRELELPLSVSSMSALATVADHGPLRAGELAGREGIQPATLTRIIKVLTDNGFIDRIPDPQDGRASLISLTHKGSETLTEARRRRAAALEARANNLSSHQRRQLAAAIPALQELAHFSAER